MLAGLAVCRPQGAAADEGGVLEEEEELHRQGVQRSVKNGFIQRVRVRHVASWLLDSLKCAWDAFQASWSWLWNECDCEGGNHDAGKY